MIFNSNSERPLFVDKIPSQTFFLFHLANKWQLLKVASLWNSSKMQLIFVARTKTYLRYLFDGF